VASTAVFVNGIPGSGKTTLATALAAELGFPLVVKDAIKESLSDLVSVELPTRQLGALASDAMWSIAGMLDEPVIVESFWASGRDEEFFRAGASNAGIVDAVEVWCEVSVETARNRFNTRPRHAVHRDATRIAEWETFAASARPISTFPTLIRNTERPVDAQELAAEILELLGPSSKVSSGTSSH
jgi:predicted kinase